MKTKYLKLVLALGLSILITSCSKNDKNDIETATLTGKWTLISYEVSNFENTGKIVDDTQKESVRPVFEFIGGNTLVYTLGGKTKTSSYILQGSIIKFNNTLAFETHDSFEYSITNNQLILKREDTYTFNNLTYIEKTTIKLVHA